MHKLQKITYLSAATIFIAAVITSNPALAASTTLNGVEISSSPERGYEIVLNTDTETSIQKKTINSDKLVLDLKNTKVSKNADTVYKNADGIENVILKPKAKDLQIEINGKEAGKSNVSLNNEIQSVPKNYNNTVFINRPMESYAPVHEDNYEEEVATGVSLAGIVKKIVHSPSLKSLFSSSNSVWILCIILMTGFFALTNFKKQKSAKINVKISNNVEDKENKLLKNALRKREELLPSDIRLNRPRTQIQPQKMSAVSAQRTNYGLKAYNNNPSDSLSNKIKAKSMLQNENILKSQMLAENKTLQTQTATATAVQEISADSNAKNEVRIDNVKFLESMAKIYEKSGRTDLANGLTNNIKKARFTR